ncbi:sugar ABC transporter ATP-binding protein [Acidisoma sp. 7E03]
MSDPATNVPKATADVKHLATKSQVALEMRGISKTFGTVQALKDVSLTAYAGEIHALMGENGAGKSTLMKILSGAYHADAGGEIRIDGKPLQIGNPLAGRRSGIAVIYQELALAPNLTVAENMFLGEEMRRHGMIDRGAMNAAAAPFLERLAAPFSPSDKVASLSIAERQLVEIARALAGHPHILVMDEPTTALSAREAEKLFTIIRTLRNEGIAIIYISHRMAEVYDLSDRVSVLRDGTMVGTLMRDELNPQTLVRMMVGRDSSSFYKKEHRAPVEGRRIALDVRDMDDGDRVHGCSFQVAEGEVLGIAGLVGSGRTELARLIYGADPKKRGQVFVNGEEKHIANPGQAIDAGIVYLTEDRKILGLFLDMSINGNVNINVIERDAKIGGILDLGAARRRAAEAIKKLGVRAPNAEINVGSLSGGNQQKVLLSRLLETNPRVLILDEPTRGVDIGAKSEIYRIIDQLARSGAAIVVISSELPEVIGVSDRVVVMRDGHLVGEVTSQPDAPITQEAIMELVTDVSAAKAA